MSGWKLGDFGGQLGLWRVKKIDTGERRLLHARHVSPGGNIYAGLDQVAKNGHHDLILHFYQQTTAHFHPSESGGPPGGPLSTDPDFHENEKFYTPYSLPKQLVLSLYLEGLITDNPYSDMSPVSHPPQLLPYHFVHNPPKYITD